MNDSVGGGRLQGAMGLRIRNKWARARICASVSAIATPVTCGETARSRFLSTGTVQMGEGTRALRWLPLG